MPSSSEVALQDIAEHIVLARLWTNGHAIETFREDRKTFYAVTRCLAIISEAVRRLSPVIMERHPDIPWPQIRAAGNIYRHQYDDVLEQDVWDTVTNRLSGLETMVAEELRA